MADRRPQTKKAATFRIAAFFQLGVSLKEKLEHVIRVVEAITVATVAAAILAIAPMAVPAPILLLTTLCAVMATLVPAFGAIMPPVAPTFHPVVAIVLTLFPARGVVVTLAVLRQFDVGCDLGTRQRYWCGGSRERRQPDDYCYGSGAECLDNLFHESPFNEAVMRLEG